MACFKIKVLTRDFHLCPSIPKCDESEFWFSKCVLRTGSMSFTWELAGTAGSRCQPPPRPHTCVLISRGVRVGGGCRDTWLKPQDHRWPLFWKPSLGIPPILTGTLALTTRLESQYILYPDSYLPGSYIVQSHRFSDPCYGFFHGQRGRLVQYPS